LYYLKTIEEKIRIPANLLGSDLEDAVLKILRDKFERRGFRDTGLVLSINDTDVTGEGVILPGDNGVYYIVKFDALCFVPYVNEVHNAVVKEIVDFGAFASIGPLQGLLHVSQIGSEKFFYDKKSKVLSSTGQKRSVKKDDELVLKISTVSIKSNPQDTKIGLTMRPLGLGKVEWLVKEEKKKDAKPSKKKDKEEPEEKTADTGKAKEKKEKKA